jgi:hypothetical protein
VHETKEVNEPAMPAIPVFVQSPSQIGSALAPQGHDVRKAEPLLPRTFESSTTTRKIALRF